MTLNDFEKIVEQKILDRGFDYYEQDLIASIEQVEINEFCATVLGSEEYNVFIKLDNQQKVIEHSCDCPYDWGNICKHEVATLFYLKDGEMYNQPIQKTTVHKIKDDLEKLHKNEIIKIIVELSKRNKAIKDEILWELGYQ